MHTYINYSKNATERIIYKLYTYIYILYTKIFTNISIYIYNRIHDSIYIRMYTQYIHINIHTYTYMKITHYIRMQLKYTVKIQFRVDNNVITR